MGLGPTVTCCGHSKAGEGVEGHPHVGANPNTHAPEAIPGEDGRRLVGQRDNKRPPVTGTVTSREGPARLRPSTKRPVPCGDTSSASHQVSGCVVHSVGSKPAPPARGEQGRLGSRTLAGCRALSPEWQRGLACTHQRPYGRVTQGTRPEAAA